VVSERDEALAKNQAVSDAALRRSFQGVLVQLEAAFDAQARPPRQIALLHQQLAEAERRVDKAETRRYMWHDGDWISSSSSRDCAGAAAAPEEVTSQPRLARVVVSELEEALANGRAAFVDDVRRHLRVAKPCRKLRPGLLRN